MEGFCRGCLIRYDDPMELLQYTEKYRRLFVYSTGLQVKRNDTITFLLCKDCFLNMKAACKFKKLCRASDKKFKSYLALKDVGDGLDFCTFLKNNDDTMTFRLPLMSGCSTPANNKSRDEDNESTCTSIRNFMTDILQGEEMPDTEARIIREVIEEEADVLDDSLDSHWLQDDASIDTDFRLDFSFSPFATPHSINNDHCYTPKTYTDQIEEQEYKKKYFTSISPARQHKLANDFTNIIKNNQSEKELCVVKQEFNNENSVDNVVYSPLINKEKSTNNFDLPIIDDEQSMNNLDLPLIDNEKSMNSLDLPSIDSDKLMHHLDLPSIPSIVDSNSMNNLDLPMSNNGECKPNNNLDLPTFDSVKSINNLDLSSIPSIDNEKSINDFDCPVIKNEDKKDIIKNFYIPNDGTDYITASKEIEMLVDSKINIKKEKKDKPCTIDMNLEKALKNENNREFSLDDLLTPQVNSNPSAASTPTISNILFGEKLDSNEDSTNKHTEQYLENNMEIFEEFFQNDCKEFEPDKTDVVPEVKVEEFKVPKDVDEVDTKKKTIINIEDPLSVFSGEQFDFENFFCNICNKKFQSSKALSIHFNKKHNIKIVKPRSKDYKYKPKICNICGREFRDLQNFHRHLKRHKNEKEPEILKCERCTLEFSSQSKLEKHMQTHKGKSIKKEPGKFICTVCGASSTTIGNFRLHQRRHTKNYTHKCKECGKGFYRPSDMAVHMRLHTGEKPFPCVYCSRFFARKDALTKHVKCHINDRPYQCEHCSVKFTSSSQLNVHLKMSVKCRKLRAVLVVDVESVQKTEHSEPEDAVDPHEAEEMDDGKAEVNIETSKTDAEIQLPYIDTEMSN